MANSKNKNNRTIFKSDLDRVCKFAALMNSGGINRNSMTAAQTLLKQCVFAHKGVEKRELTIEEVTKLIAKGYSLTE